MMEFRVFRAIGMSFKSWFRNFIPFTILAAVLFTPGVLMIVTSDPTKAHSIEDAMQRSLMYPLYVTQAMVTLLAPMLTYRVIQELNGTKVSMLTSMRYGVRGIVPSIIIAVITTVLGFIPLGGIVNLVLMCIWFVAGPAAVGEKLGPIAALSRSAELTRGRRWGIFGLSLLIGLLAIVLMVAWLVPMFQTRSGGEEAVIGKMKTLGIEFVVGMGLFYVFNGIVQAVSYALLRSDKDGLTHEQLANVFE